MNDGYLWKSEQRWFSTLALVVLVLLEQLLLEVGFVFLFLPKRDH